MGWREKLRKIRVFICGEPMSKADKELLEKMKKQIDDIYAGKYIPDEDEQIKQ